jgi:FemAB family
MNMPLSTRRILDAEWLAKSAKFRDVTFEQSLGYARPAAARIGGELNLIAVERRGQTLALAAVRVRNLPGFRRGIAWIPSGPVHIPLDGPAPDTKGKIAILSALRDELVSNQGHILRLRLPGIALCDGVDVNQIASAAGFVPTDRAAGYHSIAIDLTKDDASLMANLAGKWRTDLRFAQKSGLTLDHATGPDTGMIQRFMLMYDVVQQAKGFQPDITPQFHFNLARAGKVDDYSVEILIARRSGEDVAGIVLGTAGRCTTYLFGATADAGRPLRAGYFLQWEGIALARHKGSLWYDLGGVDADANPDVARFKERMGGIALDATAFEARPSGVFALTVSALETLRSNLRKGRAR